MLIAIIQALLLIVLCWGLAFYRASPILWVPAIGLFLLLMTLYPGFPPSVLIILWIIFVVAAFVFCYGSWRVVTFMPSVLRKFRRVLPPISDTEQIAIEAGDVWWEGELFRGQPDWNQLLSIPKPKLTAEEQAFLDNQVNTLCEMIDNWDITFNRAEIPEEIYSYLKREGFFGLAIEKIYGGHGFSAYAHSCIVTQIASRSASVAITMMVPNSLGLAEFLQHYGTEAQKQEYLPRLAKGEDIPAFALTAPEAGSDATSIKDTGIVCKDIYENKEVLGIRLNWNKRYITLAPRASLLVLAFKMYDPDHLLGNKSDIGISLCMVPTHLAGVEKGNRHFPMGLAFLNGPVRGKDVFVPLDFIIGGINNAGKGWRMLMDAMAAGRGISLPALATGITQLCFRMTGAYARVRQQFNVAIGQFEGVEEALARIGGYAYFCEATRHLTTSGIDLKIKPALVTAITKYHLTELSRSAANDAMDIHAGFAIQLGPHNYLGLFYQALPIGITVEGANILTRNLIIFGQGAVRCHPFIRAEIEAGKDADTKKGLFNFDYLLMKHIGYVLSNLSRVWAFGLTGGRFIRAPKPQKSVAYYYRQLTRMSTALAFSSDIIMLSLRGKLKRKERISARLGDILSQLYLGSAVLKYYNDQGQTSQDLAFVHWCLQKCLYEIQVAFDEIIQNYPDRWLAVLLRYLIFPWGRAYAMPSDQWGHQIAALMLHPSAFRERITQFCYVSKNKEDATGLMENAFRVLCEAELIKSKLQQAESNNLIPPNLNEDEKLKYAQQAALLTENEIELLAESQRLCLQAIQVDEFKPGVLTGMLRDK